MHRSERLRRPGSSCRATNQLDCGLRTSESVPDIEQSQLACVQRDRARRHQRHLRRERLVVSWVFYGMHRSLFSYLSVQWGRAGKSVDGTRQRCSYRREIDPQTMSPTESRMRIHLAQLLNHARVGSDRGWVVKRIAIRMIAEFSV